MEHPRFDIHIGQSSVDSSVKLNGEDINRCIKGVTVSCGNGSLTRVTFDIIPMVVASIDLSGHFMAVPRCDGCRHWFYVGTGKGACDVLSIEIDDGSVMTNSDFGCVKFSPKA